MAKHCQLCHHRAFSQAWQVGLLQCVRDSTQMTRSSARKREVTICTCDFLDMFHLPFTNVGRPQWSQSWETRELGFGVEHILTVGVMMERVGSDRSCTQHSTDWVHFAAKWKPQHLLPRAPGTIENMTGACCAQPGLRDLVTWFTLEPQSISNLSVPSLARDEALGTLRLKKKNLVQSAAFQIWIVCVWTPWGAFLNAVSIH